MQTEDCTPVTEDDDRPAMLPAYVVKPTKDARYSLSGPVLPWSVLFNDETHAVSYGHHLCRSTGGRIVILDSHGNTIITEHCTPRDAGLHLLNDYEARGVSA